MKSIWNAVPVFIAFFLMAGCGDDIDPRSGTLNEIYKYDRDLWGEWIRMDTGDTWYITSNYINVTDPDNMKLVRQSENVIKVTHGNREYYLYASRIPNGSFNGTVVNGNTQAQSIMFNRSMSGIGGIEVAITNLNDAVNEITTQTDTEGNFTADGAIPGDEYEITVDGQTTIVSPNTDGENIGTVTVTSGVNFKTSIVPQSQSTDMTALYTNTEYGFNIEINNVGSADCLAATYTLDFPEGITATSKPSSLILGTIEPGKKKTLGIKIICANFLAASEYKTINLTVTDEINNKTWNDSVSLKFVKENITFYIRSGSAISGVVIVPGVKAYSFKTSGYQSYSASVSVPKYAEKDYLVVFSGATADTEAVYSLGIGVQADSYFSGFTALGNYEQNNDEHSAVQINNGNKIMSYLHKNDIDYYKVRFD
jgi:hypothetical protein